MDQGSVALAMKSALLDGFVRSDGKDGVGHRRCSRKGSGESTALTRLGPPLNATDPSREFGDQHGIDLSGLGECHDLAPLGVVEPHA